jgi:hypothetical protein
VWQEEPGHSCSGRRQAGAGLELAERSHARSRGPPGTIRPARSRLDVVNYDPVRGYRGRVNAALPCPTLVGRSPPGNEGSLGVPRCKPKTHLPGGGCHKPGLLPWSL